MNTYHNPQDARVRFNKGTIVYSEQPHSTLLSWIIRIAFVAIVIALVLGFASVARADSISDNSLYSVPTSLCYDPLLGMSFVIYSDCGQDTQNKERDRLHSVTNDTVQENAPSVVTDDSTTQNDTQESNKHCNQGKGNGGEGCDPGNSNHNQPSNDDPVNKRGNGKNNK